MENNYGKQQLERLVMIVECAGTGYQKGYRYYDYAGTQESKRYLEEYEQQVYIPLVDFEEDITFVNAKKFVSCLGKLIFNGDFVRVKKHKTALGDKYYVYCAPLSVCKTCYLHAKSDPKFP